MSYLTYTNHHLTIQKTMVLKVVSHVSIVYRATRFEGSQEDRRSPDEDHRLVKRSLYLQQRGHEEATLLLADSRQDSRTAESQSRGSQATRRDKETGYCSAAASNRTLISHRTASLLTLATIAR